MNTRNIGCLVISLKPTYFLIYWTNRTRYLWNIL